MTFNQDIQRRRTLRLRHYDYTSDGAYFVTICTQGKACLFGQISDETMIINDAGRMIQEVWQSLPERFPSIVLDEFVVMPNHVHFIICCVGAPLVGAQNQGGHKTRPYGQSVTDIIGTFKSITTNRYITGVNKSGWKPFLGKLWQRNYYERVIRNEVELREIRQYIHYNPLKWADDPENLMQPT